MATYPSDPGKPAPATRAKALAEQRARREREAAALRENLRKRKDQAWARQSRNGDLKPD